MKYFTSDWHFGDDRIGINGKPNLFYRPFKGTYEQTSEIVNNLLSSGLRSGDTVYHLGDVFYGISEDNSDASAMSLIRSKLSGVKFILIRGNYDDGKESFLRNHFDEIYEDLVVSIQDQNFYLNHYPSNCVGHPLPCLTGHIHGLWKVQKNMINVGVDAWHFRPVSEDQILFCWNAMQKHYDENVFPY